jgi:hypothetical protein
MSAQGNLDVEINKFDMGMTRAESFHMPLNEENIQIQVF